MRPAIKDAAGRTKPWCCARKRLRKPFSRVSTASAFILASGVPAIAATEPPVEPSARMVEIPGAGAVVLLWLLFTEPDD